MLRGPIGLEAAPLLKSYVRAKALGKGANERDRRLKRPSLGRISRPIVVTACMASSSESWEPYRRPHLWHSRAGGGAVHSIKLRHMRCSKYRPRKGNVVLRHQGYGDFHTSSFSPARHADVEPRCPAFANLLVSISGLYAWLRKLAPIF